MVNKLRAQATRPFRSVLEAVGTAGGGRRYRQPRKLRSHPRCGLGLTLKTTQGGGSQQDGRTHRRSFGLPELWRSSRQGGKGRCAPGASILLSEGKGTLHHRRVVEHQPESGGQGTCGKGFLRRNATWADFLKKAVPRHRKRRLSVRHSSGSSPNAEGRYAPRRPRQHTRRLEGLVPRKARHGAIKDWMDKNPKEVQDLAGRKFLLQNTTGTMAGTRNHSRILGRVRCDRRPVSPVLQERFQGPLKNEVRNYRRSRKG